MRLDGGLRNYSKEISATSPFLSSDYKSLALHIISRGNLFSGVSDLLV